MHHRVNARPTKWHFKTRTANPFERMVKECAAKRSPRIIKNASTAHAVIIISHLLSIAREEKEDVRIVSDFLDKSFYSTLVDQAREVLQDSVPIRIAVLNGSREAMQGNGFYNAIADDQNGEVRFVENKKSMPFVVVGTSRYRTEINYGGIEALASFNDPVIGEGLVGLYEDLIYSD